MDDGTGLALATSIFGSKDLIVRVLGPTADYFGTEIEGFAKKRIKNVKKIFEAADRKNTITSTSHAVPPRVLQGILNEGSFFDDELGAEYFGGVLSSSKSGISRDDRGANINSVISRLSTYQLRAHYLFCSAFKLNFSGRDINPYDVNKLNDLKIHVDTPSYMAALDLTETEIANFESINGTILFGLKKEALIADDIIGGSPEHLKKEKNVDVLTHGYVVTPSPLGIELFLWAFGRGTDSLKSFLIIILYQKN